MVLDAVSRPPRYRRAVGSADLPLLVFGPRSTTYDFGPGHPLTPRRFGPGIDLLRTLGAEPGLAPEPASDEELRWCHSERYIRVVRRLGADPSGPPEAGIGTGDDPPFAGMHEAGAAVAGGTIRALEAILRGDVEHAFHPGGGLHHAMRDRASGFCLYDDPALAIARARAAGLRVLYLDFDVHHGDGVQALHWDDPGVLTVSIHESGRYLFPGSGFLDEIGEGTAAGTAVNIPLDPWTGEAGWLAAIRRVMPELAAAFGPDLVVSQHGADSHAWDPIAHLRVTTTAMGHAARLTDAIAHRWARGRWLATGGGGYDVYRVVPRSWSHVWLAGAHREVPAAIDEAWRQRWATEGERYGQSPPPTTFDDLPGAGEPSRDADEVLDRRAVAVADVARQLAVPALVGAAADLGWWSAEEALARPAPHYEPSTDRRWSPAILEHVDGERWSRLQLAARVIAPFEPGSAYELIAAGLRSGDGVALTAAVDGTTVVGLAVSAAPGRWAGERRLLALGVAPAARRQGLGRRLLEAHVTGLRPGDHPMTALVTAAERDPVEPLDRALRREIARRLLESTGFELMRAPGPPGEADPGALAARRD
jgi:acetoin utilization protein AcuC